MESDDEDKFDIDLEKLQARLHSAEEADALYWLQNDTKLRAVQQNCSYEEFRQLVNSSHLKPLDGGDQLQRMAEQRSYNWNSVTTGTRAVELPKSKNKEDEQDSKPSARSPQEFSRLWRAHSASERAHLLRSIGSAGLGRLFASELPSALFSEMAAILCTLQPPEEARHLLLALTATRGFQRGMCAHFLSKEVRELLRELLQAQRSCPTVAEAWEALRL